MSELSISHKQFNISIQKMLAILRETSPSEDNLTRLQTQLNQLMNRFENDQSLGRDRYQLYLAQAWLHFKRGNDKLASSSLDTAELVNGGDVKESSILRSNFVLQQTEPTKIQHGIWYRTVPWILIVFGIFLILEYITYPDASGAQMIGELVFPVALVGLGIKMTKD